MKEEGEHGSPMLPPPSKRLRLSIHRQHNNGAVRKTLDANLDSDFPSHVASSSSSSRGAQLGTAAGIQIDASNEDYVVHCSQTNVHPEMDIPLRSDPSNLADVCKVTDILQLQVPHQQPSERVDYTVDTLHDHLEEIENQQGELHGRQLEDVTTEEFPRESAAEIFSIMDSPVRLALPHGGAIQVGGLETDDAPLQDVGPSLLLHEQGQANQSSEFQEMDEGSHVDQQQDETVLSHPVTLGPAVFPSVIHTEAPDPAPEVSEDPPSSGANVSAEAQNQVIEVVQLSEGEHEGDPAQEVPTLTASTFLEQEHTPEDHDAFVPDPCVPPQPEPKDPIVETETSKPDQCCTQLESEGSACPICMEPWTSTGNHRICSLACGHLFGKSCIKRWLKQAGRKQGKCPHCNRKARIEDLRTLYVPRLTVVDGEGQQYMQMQEVSLLRIENEQLKRQVADLRQEIRRSQALLTALQPKQLEAFSSFNSFQLPQDPQARLASENRRCLTIHRTSGPTNYHQGSHSSFAILPQHPRVQHKCAHLEPVACIRNTDLSPLQNILQEQQNLRGFNARGSVSSIGMMENIRQQREERLAARPLRSLSSLASIGSRGVQNSFVLQDELPLHGAKAFDMDAHSQLLLVSRKPVDSMPSSGLTKVSLLALSEGECMDLPPGTGAIRDIRIAPSGTRAPGRLALVASLGKKLTLFSLETNNVVMSYSLQSPSWACAWDPCDPNQVSTGLQNGSILIFDMRQTKSPVATLKGPSSTPVHTLQYVTENGRNVSDENYERGRGLLSASSSSLLFWPSIDQPEAMRPIFLSQLGSSSVCVSLSYNAIVDATVASFRPKPSLTPTVDGTSSTPMEHSHTDVPSQPTTSAPADIAPSTNFRVHIPTHFSYVQKPRPPSERAGGLSGFRSNVEWEQQGAMVGHKSQMVMSRSTIVRDWGYQQPLRGGISTGQGCLFAAGDEGSNSVWLWDLGTPMARQMLMPHPSPVLDIRNVHFADMDLLGCISERTLQVYKRLPA